MIADKIKESLKSVFDKNKKDGESADLYGDNVSELPFFLRRYQNGREPIIKPFQFSRKTPELAGTLAEIINRTSKCGFFALFYFGQVHWDDMFF